MRELGDHGVRGVAAACAAGGGTGGSATTELEGYGTSSTFGSSGDTCTVTTMDDSGDGSLRDCVENRDGRASYSGRGFSVQFDAADPEGTITGEATAEVDLACFAIIDSLFQALFDSAAVNAVNCL